MKCLEYTPRVIAELMASQSIVEGFKADSADMYYQRIGAYDVAYMPLSRNLAHGSVGIVVEGLSFPVYTISPERVSSVYMMQSVMGMVRQTVSSAAHKLRLNIPKRFEKKESNKPFTARFELYGISYRIEVENFVMDGDVKWRWRFCDDHQIITHNAHVSAQFVNGENGYSIHSSKANAFREAREVASEYLAIHKPNYDKFELTPERVQTVREMVVDRASVFHPAVIACYQRVCDVYKK